MFDLQTTLSLIRGGLLDARPTWNSFLAKNPDLKTTFIQLTGPLIAANVLLTVILSRTIGGYSLYGWGLGWFSALILGLLTSLIFFAIGSFVISTLAGMFGGKKDLERSFASLSLVAIPAYAGAIVAAAIPFIGWLISLAASILSLVYLYRILPLALEIPEDKRTPHFIVSIIVIVIINIFASAFIAGGTIGSDHTGRYSANNTDEEDVARGGMFSGIMRQAELQEAASKDRYDPPNNGKVSEDQVRQLITVYDKTAAWQARQAKQLEKLSEQVENKDNPSLSDIARVYQGAAGGVMGYSNAEMEVVKTGGGNWAEHQWVKTQLRAAVIQQGGDDALDHNYQLYQEYAEDLEKVVH